MAKWKMMGQMALAIREAEKQAEAKRLLEEQRAESVKYAQMLRKLERQKAMVAASMKLPNMHYRTVLKPLKAELRHAEMNAEVARGKCHQQLEQKCVQKIIKSIDTEDGSNEKISNIKKEMQLLNLKAKELDKEIRETRTQLAIFKKNRDRTRVVNTDKVTRRQEVHYNSYGLQLDKNRVLQGQIDHLLQERAKLQVMYLELKKDIKGLSSLVGEFTEVAKTSFEHTALGRTSIVKFIEDFDRSHAAFESDMQLLQFKIDVLLRTERFMTDKNKFRVNTSKQRRAELLTQQSVLDKEALNSKETLESIRDGLQQHQVHVIVNTFRELEEENYMLFKNISVTREACNNMTLEIERIKVEIEDMKHAKHMTDDEESARRVEIMEKTQACTKLATEKEAYIQETDKLLQAYITAVMGILNNLGYTEDQITALAGVYKRVEERNIQEFLAELEKYVTKLTELKTLAEYISWNRARKAGEHQQPTPLPPRLATIQSVAVVPPSYLDGEDVDDPALPADAAYRPLDVRELIHHIDEDLDLRHRRNELGVVVPSPTMNDASSEAIGDTPKSPGIGKATLNVDVF